MDTECWACGGEKFKVKLNNTLGGGKIAAGSETLWRYEITTFFVPAPSSLGPVSPLPSLPNPTFSI